MQAVAHSTAVRLEIQKLNDLPAMSLAVQQFLQALQNSDMELRQLAAIIERDPALLARIIGLANSAYFGYPEKVVTAEDAIFKVLGLNTAKSLALSIVLAGAFDSRRCRGFRLDDYWQHAMGVAVLAQRLAPHVTVLPRFTANEAYLGGLLHSIGLLALVHLYPSAMAQVFAEGASDPGALLEREHLLIGADHGEVGGWLARKWGLPHDTIAVIERHLHHVSAGPSWPLTELIGRCAAWVTAAGGTEIPPLDLSSIGVAPALVEPACRAFLEQRAEIAALARTIARG